MVNWPFSRYFTLYSVPTGGVYCNYLSYNLEEGRGKHTHVRSLDWFQNVKVIQCFKCTLMFIVTSKVLEGNLTLQTPIQYLLCKTNDLSKPNEVICFTKNILCCLSQLYTATVYYYSTVVRISSIGKIFVLLLVISVVRQSHIIEFKSCFLIILVQCSLVEKLAFRCINQHFWHCSLSWGLSWLNPCEHISSIM